ncbi:hypothetical protein BDY17DRAFT_328568 [Neohortaea acidophila]|uniref:PRISE-like Rossmann-fold domain-containing protein n=1 Tax=Neohortaea acidophila TaxID=245834 RepID=A0A6A6Q4R9_9PEZI|nr:uncharacterized protein BDY17DRAFT_328568 [Neohortaea acidophila]KAF2486994.1 hypothetical protein BDY17DRAFT_328568 [Neohortaea acidophila]
MGSERYPLQNKGIFRNLPSFDPNIKGLTALVTGANGISGFHTMRALLESPQRWTKVWAASRRPPPEEMMALLTAEERSRVEHVACDFLAEPEVLARQLTDKGVTADYVFFCMSPERREDITLTEVDSYAHPRPPEGQQIWSNAQELVDVNTSLIRNLTQAMDIANIVPKRFLLQTGAKNYGLHLGPTRTPHVESDPRVLLEPNFYYPQEDVLQEYCAKHKIGWNVICPAWIIGATQNAAMNALHPFAVYAAVKQHRGEKLDFPGNAAAWLENHEHSTAQLTGYLSEWAVLEDKCANQKFNAGDNSLLPNNRLWPELARWFGCKEVGLPESDDAKITTIPGGDKPTPIGYVSQPGFHFSFTMSHWAQQPENVEAWKEIMKKHKLTHNPFDDPECWAFADVAAWGGRFQLSTNKAQNFGYTGHVDTLQSLHRAYSEFNKIGMLPPMVADARPLQ